MGKKCCVPLCCSGYASSSDRRTQFTFPRDKDLQQNWIAALRRKDFSLTSNTTICDKHFEDRFKRRTSTGQLKLDFALNPIPTIFDFAVSVKTTIAPPRKKPKVRGVLSDELHDFNRIDLLNDISSLSISDAPLGWHLSRKPNAVWFYLLKEDEPSTIAAVVVQSTLLTTLYVDNAPVCYPPWLRSLPNCKLTRRSQVTELCNYCKNFYDEKVCDFSDDEGNQNYALLKTFVNLRFKQKTSPFPASVMRFGLLIHHTSPKVYQHLLNVFPLPKERTLRKLSSGTIDSFAYLSKLLENGTMSEDCTIALDEIYIQQEVRYDGNQLIGADETRSCFKTILCFMTIPIKSGPPVLIQAIPCVRAEHRQFFKHVIDLLSKLITTANLKIRAICSDNNRVNVSLFRLLQQSYPCGDNKFVIDSNGIIIHLIFDVVHILKTIRNNWLKLSGFTVPSLNITVDMLDLLINDRSKISWSLLHQLYDADMKRASANLRVAPQLSFSALHPWNNKQSVPLALAVFNPTNSAALRKMFPSNPCMQPTASFITLIYVWFNILNARSPHNPVQIASGIRLGDGKLEFLRTFSDWVRRWQESKLPGLSKQNFEALIFTTESITELCGQLLASGYNFVLTRNLQSDPLERHFSRYRQMSGGRFLVGLYDILKSEKIIKILTLFKYCEHLDFVDLREADFPDVTFVNEISSSIDAEDIPPLDENFDDTVQYIAGYVSRRIGLLVNASNCPCKEILKSVTAETSQHLRDINRGGLITPSKNVCKFLKECFAIIDFISPQLLKIDNALRLSARKIILNLLSCPSPFHSCEIHCSRATDKLIDTVINVFFNNFQKRIKDDVRKDSVKDFKRRQRRKSE